MYTIAKEDYLSIIFKNISLNGEIKPNTIASKLSVSSAAVTDMLKKLATDGLIVYHPYKGIKITIEGEKYARNIVRHHRIWEVFLNQIVGIPLDKVHHEADMLEHSSSDDLINRIDEILNFPKYDPHGDPIPSKDGKIPELKKNIKLSNLKEGRSGKIIRLNDFDENFLAYITKIGIMLEEIIKVKQKRNRLINRWKLLLKTKPGTSAKNLLKMFLWKKYKI